MSYIALATTTLGTATATVTFSSIPATYRDLVIVIIGTQTATGTNGGWMRFNSDSGSNYSRVRMMGTGSAASSNTLSGTEMEVMVLQAQQSNFIINVMDYSATDKHKTVLGRSNSDFATIANAGRWASTSAVTSVTLGVYATTFIGYFYLLNNSKN
jgi:hypothetical protein